MNGGEGGGDEDLAAALRHLRVEPPARLLSRVVAKWAEVESPVGELLVGFTDHGVAYTRLTSALPSGADGFRQEFRERFRRPLLPASRLPPGLLAALRSGRSTGLAFDLRGLSAFEQSVLRKTQEIPRGEVRPYGWVAAEIGRPRAVRAAGSALGRNPVPLLIPCHRVVRGDGRIGEYIFGTGVKSALLGGEGLSLDELDTLARSGVRFVASDTTGIVCFPSCHAARRISPAHRIPFGSIGQALRGGYRPCRLCRPPATPAGSSDPRAAMFPGDYGTAL